MLKKIIKKAKLNAWSQFKEDQRRFHNLTYLFWECTLNCNFDCKHCGSSAGITKFEDDLTTEEIKSVFDDVAKNYNPKKITIAITGGEPLTRKDLFEVMKYAKSLGFYWGMVTNGFLVDEKIIAKMKDSGMDTVVVSVDGVGETHDNFRNKKGAYNRAINALKLLSEEKFLKGIQITTTINKTNINELEEMYKIFKTLGITSWRVVNMDPIGRAEINDKLLLDQNEFKQMMDFIRLKRKEDKTFDITYSCVGFLGSEYEGETRNKLFDCNTGINIGSILQNGDIFVCPNVPRRTELIQGNVRNDSFVDVWNNKFKIFRKKDRTSCDKCLDCTEWENCLGGAFHLWDFDKNETKICHYEQLNK